MVDRVREGVASLISRHGLGLSFPTQKRNKKRRGSIALKSLSVVSRIARNIPQSFEDGASIDFVFKWRSKG